MGGGGAICICQEPLLLKLSSINSLYIQGLSSNESPHLVKSGTNSSAQSRLLTKDRWTQVAGRPCQTPRGEAGSQSNKTSFLCDISNKRHKFKNPQKTVYSPKRFG